MVSGKTLWLQGKKLTQPSQQIVQQLQVEGYTVQSTTAPFPAVDVHEMLWTYHAESEIIKQITGIIS
jgi:hypothetical protein